MKKNNTLFIIFLLVSFSLIFKEINAEELFRPDRLSVDLMLNTDRVYKNAYPTNIPLTDVVNLGKQYQYVEIHKEKPLFGWCVVSEKQNTVQHAYQILVSSGIEKINNNIGDLWDTGKIMSNNSINIPYAGKKTEPNKIYFWKVKIWNNHGEESSFSSIQQFKTANELKKYFTSKYPLQKTDIAPKVISKINSKRCFVDFGKASFGQLRLKLYSDNNNDSIIIHLGESAKDGLVERNPEGSVVYNFYKLALKPGWNTYEIVIPKRKMKRPERAIYMPEYIGEVMPFRYCEIENYPFDLIESSNIEQIAVNYEFNDAATYFHSSNQVLNDVWDLCKHSIKATSFMGIYVDGDRERFPREADSYINQLSHYGVERGFSIARYTHEFQIGYSSVWTEWILQVVMSAWADYMQTGDASSLLKYYDDIKAKALLPLAREDGLISTKTGLVTKEIREKVHFSEIESRRQRTENPTFRDITDWPQKGFGAKTTKGETDGFEFKPINTVVNAYHYGALVLMAKIAETLGKSTDTKLFNNQAALVKKSVNNKLIDTKTGIYIDGEGSEHSSLHANMFPLEFNMVPDKNIKTVTDFIKSRGMACSVYGSQHLLEGLYNANQDDYALELLTSKDTRSWANMIYNVGSTISLEAWDIQYKPNLDWNHAWGAAPGNIIPNKIMGIEPLEPGFGKIRIKPQPSTLKHAEIKYHTVRGDVFVSFENEKGNFFKLKTNIPANTTADIYLPKYFKKQNVEINNKTAKYIEKEGYLVIEEVGSGEKNINIIPVR